MSQTIAKRCVVAFTVLILAFFAVTAAQAQVPLSITLTPGTDPNGEPTYKASVTNNSLTAHAFHLTVTYTTPFWELPISPSPSGGCLFNLTPFHLMAVCQIPDLAPQQTQDFVIAIHPTDTSPQDVTAVATEDAGGTASAFVTSTITGVGLTEMQVTMTSTNPGKVGEQLVYKVTVYNIQDDDAQNVYAVLALPKNTTFVSATKGCARGTLVLCKLGSMSPGTGKTVTVTVLPTLSGWTQATAGVRLGTPDRDPSNNSAATSIWVNP
jgi:uncharacterized repeat protein (TIGR01451 family)